MDELRKGDVFTETVYQVCLQVTYMREGDVHYNTENISYTEERPARETYDVAVALAGLGVPENHKFVEEYLGNCGHLREVTGLFKVDITTTRLE